ncbi:MAG: sulfite exporter TauE/SafE family protein [Chitinophagaceae bacterium]|nr:sulfite exporter TauE/SafE family protein [Chitinophagaceae bacterium]
MDWSIAITGFTLGAAGSLHCIGMCGPLSLALPVHHFSKTGKLVALLLYQTGRILTYTVIGLLFGLAGRMIYVAGYQQLFSIIMGVLILLLALLYFLHKSHFRVPFLNRFYQGVQQLIIRVLKSSTSLLSFLLLGMANGLLPCGMVYIALATSLSFSGLEESAGFMASFGAGTLPAMMLVGYAGMMIRPELRSGFRKLVPVFITLMGVILILRGLNLGIPYLSPELPHSPGGSIDCHP